MKKDDFREKILKIVNDLDFKESYKKVDDDKKTKYIILIASGGEHKSPILNAEPVALTDLVYSMYKDIVLDSEDIPDIDKREVLQYFISNLQSQLNVDDDF